MSDFVHLHVHTEYSLLDGAGKIKKLVARAAELGMKAMAITDHGSMYGVIEFYKEAKKVGIKPLIGCEVYVAPRSRQERAPVNGELYYHLVLLAKDNAGYRNLIKLVSRAHLEGFYYKPRVDKELLAEYSEGLICLSACIAGEVPSLLLKDDPAGAESAAREYLDIFGSDNFYLEIQDHGIPEQAKANKGIIALAAKLNIGLVATNDLHYINKEDADCHDILLCIQTGKTVDDPGRMKFATPEFYLKSADEMAQLFPDVPEAYANTVKIAERCNVEFEFGHLQLPQFPLPAGMTDEEYLTNMCQTQLPIKFPDNQAAAQERLTYELSVIKQMGYFSYFLIVWDFVNFAKNHNIPVGPGRGSAAGSIVAYLMGITNIDPLKYDLLFERFLNPERVSMPDIDIDFCYEKRQQVIDYVADRYGADRVAQIITFGTLAAKAAVRDVGRALNMSYGEVDRIAKLIPNVLGMTLERAMQEGELRALYQQDQQVKRLLDMAQALEGLPRHASTHAAGLVIAKEPITNFVPVQNSAEGFVTTQYDKDRIEELGLLKMDLLGLRTLTVIGDAISMVKSGRGIDIDIDAIPLADDKTCAMLQRGETTGVFQMESSGMTTLMKDLHPESFTDLIPLVALYRPGPLGSGMVDDFIGGRHGRKKITYLHPLLEPILKDTFGVILYQEQVMQIASTLAGFSLGQADLLRRAMGKKKRSVLAAQHDAFMAGAAKKGIEPSLAQEIFDLMAHFADYGFNKSHSAAYALVAYQTAYLKAHFPAEFMAALLTSVMGTPEKVSHYIEEARKMAIAVLPPDINASVAGWTVDGQAIRFGLAGVKNVGEGAVESIIVSRQKGGAFTSLIDFCRRNDLHALNKRSIESLIKAGAMDSLGCRRAQLLEVVEQAVDLAVRLQRDEASGQIDLFGGDDYDAAADVPLPDIAELPPERILAMEKEMTGFYVSGHPLDKYRDKLRAVTPISAIDDRQYRDGQVVTIGGLITSAKRITTKNGELMCFITIEDLTASLEVIIFPRLFNKVNGLVLPDMPVAASGRLSVAENEIKLLADNVRRLEDGQQEVRLTISGDQENSRIFGSLKQIFTVYHGATPVYLHLTASDRVIKNDKQFWLEPSQEAIDALGRLLGKSHVHMT